MLRLDDLAERWRALPETTLEEKGQKLLIAMLLTAAAEAPSSSDERLELFQTACKVLEFLEGVENA